MSTLDPLVSVIIPAYNRADLVCETIDSVLSQDYPHVEVLVLDDGSTDHTVEVLESYGSRISWSTHPNMGETRTVNRGFSLAKGEILTVLSSDDLFLPGVISKAVETLQNNPETVVCYCDYLFIDDSGKVLQFWKSLEFDLLDVLRDCECPPGPGAFFWREVAEKVGGRDERLRGVADFEFWLRMALEGSIQRVPGFGSAFREHGHSTSVAGLSTDIGQELLTVVERYFERPDLPEAVRAVRQEAIGGANFVAGCRCGNNFWFQLRCFARAFPYISNRRRLRALLELTQGFAWGRFIKGLLINRIRQADGVGQHYSEVSTGSGDFGSGGPGPQSSVSI
jgi:glycosyltransferase involved in cell wall biosynthesis